MCLHNKFIILVMFESNSLSLFIPLLGTQITITWTRRVLFPDYSADKNSRKNTQIKNFHDFIWSLTIKVGQILHCNMSLMFNIQHNNNKMDPFSEMDIPGIQDAHNANEHNMQSDELSYTFS